MIQIAWMLCTASVLASPTSEKQPTRSYVLSGEILIYPPSTSGLPLSTVIAKQGARSERDLLLTIESLSDVSDDYKRFDSGALVHARTPLMMGELAGGSALELGDLSLHLEKTGWIFYAESGDMKGRPILTLPADAAALTRVSNDEFVISGELQLHEAMAAELGLRGAALPPSLAVGAMTLHASTYPGQPAVTPSTQSFTWQPTGVVSSALSIAGPDVVVSGIGGTSLAHTPTGASPTGGVVGAITAYSVQTISCNIGTQDAEWFDAGTVPGPNHHPVIGSQVYRLKTVSGSTRFEQIGMSWLKHGFCAADAPNCGSPYVQNSSCDWLGLFATDTYGSGLNGTQTNLGPRSEIQPFTGVYPYPFVLGAGQSGDAIFKRCQVLTADLDPAQNVGAQYLTEVVYICTDEPDANKYNNYSNRTTTVGTLQTTGYDLALTGSTRWQQSALEQWQVLDPTVTVVNVNAPGDGRFYVGAKVTNLGGGLWHYEYAVFNMNCDASARLIQVPADATVNVTNVGFHDVPYHSGEPYSGTDWPTNRTTTNVEWSTSTFATNANANALRWSTTYNFRFDANIGPVSGNVQIGLFKVAGNVTAVGLPVPDSFGFPSPFCYGDGSGTACPCGNGGAPGRGCGNFGSILGGQLGYTGLPRISADTLVLTASSVLPFGPGLFFQGSASIPTGTVFGNGLLCLGGTTPRLEIRTADATGTSSTTVAIHVLGGTAAGDVRHYQLWFRDDPSMCAGSGFNLTNALSATWVP